MASKEETKNKLEEIIKKYKQTGQIDLSLIKEFNSLNVKVEIKIE